MKRQYVQHISGQGEKWEIIDQSGRAKNCELEWIVNRNGYCFNLPKSEYCLCKPPEEWEDKTVDYKTYSGVKGLTLYDNERLIYREGLHNGPHFLVERKKV